MDVNKEEFVPCGTVMTISRCMEGGLGDEVVHLTARWVIVALVVVR